MQTNIQKSETLAALDSMRLLADSPTLIHVLKFAARMEAKLAKNRHKGDREPAMSKTEGTKHVGIRDLLDCAGWLENKAQEERSVAAQWATEGRKSPHNIEAAEKFEAWARVMRDEVAAQSNADLNHGEDTKHGT